MKKRIVADMRIIESISTEKTVGNVGITTFERVYKSKDSKNNEPLDRVVNLFEQRTPVMNPFSRREEAVELLYVVRLAINNKYVEEKAFEDYDDSYNCMVLWAYPEDAATEH